MSKTEDLELSVDASFFYMDPKTGIFLKDKEEIIKTLTTFFKMNFGGDIEVDLKADTNLGAMLRMFTDIVSANAASIVHGVNQNNILAATGIFLDNLGAAKGLLRHKARRASVIATIVGKPMIKIPKGFKAISKKGDVFFAAEDVTLDVSGKARLLFLSEEAKKISVKIGELNKVVDRIDGVSSIFNDEESLAGSNQESDVVYRERIKEAVFLTAATTPKSLVTYILQNSPETLDALVVNNNTDEVIKLSSIEIPVGFFWVCVLGGAPENLARAIFLKAGGTPTVGKEKIKFIDKTSGLPFIVKFNYATQKPFDIFIKINSNINDLDSKIRGAFKELKEGALKDERLLRIGKTINAVSVSQFLARKIPNLDLSTVGVGYFKDKDKIIKFEETFKEILKEIVELEGKASLTKDDEKKLIEYTARLILYSFVKYMISNNLNHDDLATSSRLLAIEEQLNLDVSNYLAQQFIVTTFKKLAGLSNPTFKDALNALVEDVKDIINLKSDDAYTWAISIEQLFTPSAEIKIDLDQVGVPDKIAVVLGA